MKRILVAVDDSPASLAAARTAIALAVATGGRVCAVSVEEDGASTRAVLGLAKRLGRAADVPLEAVAADGLPFEAILDQARTWGADVIVMGRSDHRGPRSTYLGGQAAHVIEFTDRPVMVVPEETRGDGSTTPPGGSIST